MPLSNARQSEQPEAEQSEVEQHEEQQHYHRIPVLKKLFKSAEDVHADYKVGSKLSPKERNAMSSGLSGILDLTDDNQADSFTDQEWKAMKAHYINKYKIEQVELSSNIKEKWNYIAAKCIKEKNVEAGRKYIDRLCATAITNQVQSGTPPFS